MKFAANVPIVPGEARRPHRSRRAASRHSDEFTLAWIASRVGGQRGCNSPQVCGQNRRSTDFAQGTTISTQLEGLGALKQLAQAASLIGGSFDPMLLAAVLEMDSASLVSHLEHLVRTGVLARDTSSPNSLYGFSHALLREAAYASIPDDIRRALHAKISRAITSAFPQMAEAHPEVVAEHWIAAGQHRDAAPWWRRSAAHAITRGTARRAVVDLQRAVVAGRQMSPAERVEEIDRLSLLAGQLGQLRGIGAPEVTAIYRRALDLMDDLPSPDAARKFDLLWGLEGSYMARGEIGEALRTGDELVASALRAGSADQLLLARRRNALAQFMQGNVVASITLHAAVLALHDQERHARLRYTHISDQGTLALSYLAWAEAIAARPAAAVKHSRAALRAAGRVKHPHTGAHVLCVLASVAQTIGDASHAAALANAGRSLSLHHEFAYGTAWAELVLGWHTGLRSPVAGMRAIQRAIVKYRATESQQGLPYALTLLAETALAAGRPARARTVLERASQVAERCGIRLFAAETARLRAEAEAALGARPEVVASLLLVSMRTAERQGAFLFRARAESSARRLAPDATAGGCQPRAPQTERALGT